jgi:hypothetical protein
LILRRFAPQDWAVILAITAILYGGFAFLQLRKHGLDPSVLVLAGEQFTDRAEAPPELTVYPDAGYDGQFYFRLAMAPFSTAERAAGVRFDYPVYRQQRIVQGLLVRALSFGSARATLWLLLLVNIAAACAIALAGVRIARHYDLSPLYALALSLYPGYLLTMTRDLVEIVELAFVAWAMLAILRRKTVAAVVLLTIAALTKEPALLVAAGPLATLALDVVRRRASLRDARLLYAAPFAVFFAWKAFLFSLWGFPFNLGTGALVAPFAVVARRVAETFPPRQRWDALFLAEVLLLAVFCVVIAMAMRRSFAPLELKLSWVAYLLLTVTLGELFWAEDWSFLRATSELAALGAVVALSSTIMMRRVVAVGVPVLWVLMAWEILTHR